MEDLNPEPPTPLWGVLGVGLMVPYENRRFSIPLWGFSRGSGLKGDFITLCVKIFVCLVVLKSSLFLKLPCTPRGGNGLGSLIPFGYKTPNHFYLNPPSYFPKGGVFKPVGGLLITPLWGVDSPQNPL